MSAGRTGDCACGAFCGVRFLWSLTLIWMGNADVIPHLFEMWGTPLLSRS